jgi:hypothetical protein
MKRLLIIILLVGIGLTVTLYRLNYGFWPPRTPYKVASLVSKVEVTASSKLLFSEELWQSISFASDGDFSALFVITEPHFFEKLYKTGNFKPLDNSVLSTLSIPENVRMILTKDSVKGRYELINDPIDTTILRLTDEKTGHYYVLYSII